MAINCETVEGSLEQEDQSGAFFPAVDNMAIPLQSGPYRPGMQSSHAVPMNASLQLHRPEP